MIIGRAKEVERLLAQLSASISVKWAAGDHYSMLENLDCKFSQAFFAMVQLAREQGQETAPLW